MKAIMNYESVVSNRSGLACLLASEEVGVEPNEKHPTISSRPPAGSHPS